MLRVDAREAALDARAQLARGQQPDRAAREARHEDILDARRRAHVEAQILRHIADDGMARVLALRIDIVERSRVRHLAEDGAQQRALARAVRTDERRELPAVDMEMHMLEDRQAPDANREIIDFRAAEFRAVLA